MLATLLRRSHIPVAAVALLMACTSDDAVDTRSDTGPGVDDVGDAFDVSVDEDAAVDARRDTGAVAPDTDDAAWVAPGEPGDATPLDGLAVEPIGPEGPCGTPVRVVDSTVRRLPYLQSVLTDSARVAWTDLDGEEGQVRYSVAGSGLWATAAAEARWFPTSYTSAEADYTAFDATLVGLTGDVDVCYEVFVDGRIAVAGAALHTAWTSHDRPLSLIAVGDSGNGSPEQIALAGAMSASAPDVFLHLGDMAYGDGTWVEFEAHVFDVYADMMHAVPMWPTPGNHEYKTRSALPYRDVYYLPEQAMREHEQEYYYSFDYGNVHFVSLDSNGERSISILGDTGDDMLDWLEADLAATDAEWIIAFMHHPTYSSGEHGNEAWLHGFVVPILEAHDVDLVLAGHDHHYERSRQILADEAVELPTAPIYVVAGAGGAGLRDAPGDWFTAAVNDEQHNFLHLVIDGCTATGRALTADNSIVDEFTIDGCD